MFEGPKIATTENPRSPESFPDVQKALERGKKLVFDYAIDPNEFKRSQGGAYEDVSVDDDLKHIGELKVKMRDQGHDLAVHGSKAHWEMLQNLGKIFEAIVLHNAGSNDWLGENASVIVPSEYDDVKNGIDGIVEFEGARGYFSYLALAMDMTTSVELAGKIYRIKQDIDAGHLSSAKYFHSEKQGFYGQKRNVPRVIVGADKKTVHDLMILWNGTNHPSGLMDNKGMSQHSMQIQMLDEMALQLETFARYAQSRGKQDLVTIYSNDLDKIRGILALKEAELGRDRIRKMRQEAGKDLVYQKIIQIMGRI